eukprot:752116-Hanusia_phi.AAC.1
MKCLFSFLVDQRQQQHRPKDSISSTSLRFLRQEHQKSHRETTAGDTVLLLSLEEKLFPILAFLMDELSLSKEEVCFQLDSSLLIIAQAVAVLSSNPTLFGFSISSNLRPKVQFYTQRVRRTGCLDQQHLIDLQLSICPGDVGRMLSKYPQLLCLSIK